MTGTPEELRARYQPRDVRVLFVGESPPAGGTFFYAANSKLYAATRSAFFAAVSELLNEPFLESFAALGCYLDDLCLRPVNHLKLSILDQKRERLAERRAGEAALAERMQGLNPDAIVMVMSGIEENVRRAATAARMPDRVLAVLPFPGRPEHLRRFDAGLQEVLVGLKETGVLTARGPLS